MTTTQEQADRFADAFTRVLGNVTSVIKGKRDEVGMVLVALFAEGHVLLEDVPGTGKTVLAKSIANSFGGDWSRVQFTPDLLPADVTGGLVYNQSRGSFDVHRGPVFANVVLADEINRASPKTQSALLQVMEERQVTIGDTTHDVPRPFGVVATQNPIEQEGTYRLPEAQLDRFLMRMALGYPDHDHEVDVLRDAAAGVRPDSLNAVISTEQARQMIAVVNGIHLDDAMRSYVVRLCAATRELSELRLGVSTRGALAIMRAASSLAATQARIYVNIDDVKAVAHAVMGHRLLLTPEAELRSVRTDDLVDRVLAQVEAPAARRAA
ncbi:AAA family ATPase [Salsipaludibacter albus]|uniref:AAA family ATPase n=1 Tax=Salsipaludibacter albus TaxID=2849650 RepID=UPI001EE3BBB6|nr:MoxR family ATPase [Salsipaludibacter albus]MBY5161289.1 MoxR family ATPase [Salsipaludibacter albus]